MENNQSYLFYVLLTILLLLTACGEKQKLEWFDLNLEFPGQVEEFNGGILPNYLEPFVNYQEFKKCKNVMYVPKITIKRMDVGLSQKLNPPLTGQAKFQMKMKMLAPQHIKDGYKVEDLKLPDFLNKPKSEFDEKELKTLKPAQKYVITLPADANKEQVENAHKILEKFLCKDGAKNITIRIQQSLPGDGETTGGDQGEGEGVIKASIAPPPPPSPGPEGGTITVGNTHFTKRGGNYYSAYARYEGGVENGKAHGQGTMIFTRSHLIPVPPYSAKKITARKGYKLAGRFNNGYFVSGKLYDASGRKIKSIYIGR